MVIFIGIFSQCMRAYVCMFVSVLKLREIEAFEIQNREIQNNSL